jgi:hypothetical protein
MTLQETPPPIDDVAMDLDLRLVDPHALPRFGRLADTDRVRIIIRLICGLVALEEDPEPDPPRLRTLPFLGIELDRHQKHPATQTTRTLPLLPYLGNERPF